jgi:hypothetical protein
MNGRDDLRATLKSTRLGTFGETLRLKQASLMYAYR